MLPKILFLVTVFLTNIIQCITGFAGTVLAMPFSIRLIGLDSARSILNLLGLLASVYVVIVCRKSIDIKEFGKMAGLMFIGMGAGLFLKKYFSGNPSLLYIILGVTVIIFAVTNAVKFYTGKEDKPFPEPVAVPLAVIGGIVHGMFVCGGPLLVTYASGKIKDKDTFRGTLSLVWILLNGIIFATDIHSGYFTLPTVKLAVVSAAVLAAALVVGNLICKKLSRSFFLQLTYVLMFISGISLLIK